jgi:phage N-6-adenine-methyltransferase
MKIPVEKVIDKERLRKVDGKKVQELADSIKEIGLLAPISITKDFVLVAGAHRLEACKLLEHKEIQFVVFDAEDLLLELAEIDENLIRSELHWLDRGKHLERRKEIYEELHPETKREATLKQNLPKDGIRLSDALSFVKDTATKTGKSETVIKEELQIAKNVIPEVQEVIKKNDIPKTDALQIARMEPQEQKEVVEKIIVENLSPKAAIEEVKKPHVTYNSGENEWYTPREYIDAAVKVMGSIDLDPASCELANKVVGAKKIFTIDEDGLSKDWRGNVWLNPPYSSDLIGKFVSKLVESFRDGSVSQAIVLVNNATETQWFNNLIEPASAFVFPKGRVKFYTPNGKTGQPLQGQAVIYYGDYPDKFLLLFERFGWGATI